MTSPAFLRVLLVRHGQSTNNERLSSSFGAFVSSRHPDCGLTPLGAEQAAATGAALAHAQPARDPPISAVYCSAMRRALHTAALLAAPLGLPPVVWSDLHEVGGSFVLMTDTATGAIVGAVGAPGMTAAQVAAAFPSALLSDASGVNASGWYRRGGRETEAEAEARLRGVLRLLRARAAALAAPGTPPRPAVTLPLPPAERAGPRGRGFWVPPTLVDGSTECDAAAAAARRTNAAAAMAAAGPAAPGPVARVDCGAAAIRGVAAVDSANEVLRALPAFRSPQSPAVKRAAGSGDGRGAVAPAPAAPAPASATECIALVTHSDAMDVLLRLALRDGRGRGEGGADVRFRHCNCAVTALDVFPDGAVRVLAVNDAGHLPPRLHACGPHA